MYNRAFPVGNALFLFTGGVMSLLRLPRGKLPLAFLAVPAGKDGRVECTCQTVNDFIGENRILERNYRITGNIEGKQIIIEQNLLYSPAGREERGFGLFV